MIGALRVKNLSKTYLEDLNCLQKLSADNKSWKFGYSLESHLLNLFETFQYAYLTGHFVLHSFLSTFMIIFFMLVDTLFTQCALKCKKCATQMKHEMTSRISVLKLYTNIKLL